MSPVLLRRALRHGAALVATAGLAAALTTPSPGQASEPTNPAPRASGVAVRVGSYNIVNVALDKQASGNALPWAKRRAAVAAAILRGKLDVVGLQEASQWNDYDYVSPTALTQFGDLVLGLLAKGATYKVVDAARDSSGDTRILYNPTRVTVVKHGVYDYTGDTASGEGTSYLVWAVFKTVQGGHKFFYANTHLIPHHTDLQKKEWLQLITKVKDLRDGLPVIVGGDFQQSKWHEPTVSMLPKMKKAGFGDVTGSVPKDDHLRHPRPDTLTRAWLDSTNKWDRVVKNNSVSPRQGRIGANIDWIFATNSLHVNSWTVDAKLNSATSKYVDTMPSDHNLVWASIVIP